MRERYFISELDPTFFEPMGILLLARFPLDRIRVQNYNQQYSIPKTMLFAEWHCFHRRRISFGLVHLKASSGVGSLLANCHDFLLTSDRIGIFYYQYAETRKREVEETIAVQMAQEGIDDAFLLGDFNFR